MCGGLSKTTGVDVTLVRIAFAVLALGSGIGVLAYVLAWLFIPLEGESTTILSRAAKDRRGIRLVIAIIPVLVLVQVLASTLRVGYVGSFSWPIFLAAGVAILSAATPANRSGCGSTTTSSRRSMAAPIGTHAGRWPPVSLPG